MLVASEDVHLRLGRRIACQWFRRTNSFEVHLEFISSSPEGSDRFLKLCPKWKPRVI